MRHSEQLNEIAPALVKASRSIKPVHKDSTNPHFKSKFASLDAIAAAALPALHDAGIAVLQGGGQQDDAGIEVVTRLLHISGQWIETAVRMPLDKASAQGAGSAMTYGRRYGLAAILSIVTDDDDDGNAATANSRPALANVRPSNGSVPVMAFGKSKGTPLDEVDPADIGRAIAWAKEKDKFSEFVVEAEAFLVGA